MDTRESYAALMSDLLWEQSIYGKDNPVIQAYYDRKIAHLSIIIGEKYGSGARTEA